MISPVRQNIFERAASTPALSMRELALLLCGLDLRLQTPRYRRISGNTMTSGFTRYPGR